MYSNIITPCVHAQAGLSN